MVEKKKRGPFKSGDKCFGALKNKVFGGVGFLPPSSQECKIKIVKKGQCWERFCQVCIF